MEYLVAVVFGVNLFLAFGPPTWALVVLSRLSLICLPSPRCGGAVSVAAVEWSSQG